MKKILSLVLVLVLTMSLFAVVAAAEGTGTPVELPETTLPSIGEAFQAVSDFLKLEALTPYFDAFHAAFGDFYIQLDVWLRAIGVVLNGALGEFLSSGFFG